MKKNKNLIIIAIIAIVNALGYGIIIPLIYPYSQKFGLTDFQNGMLFSIYSLCAFIASPIIGRMSDKYGRKPLLAISTLGTGVSFFMQAFAPSALWLFLARALDGVTAGNIPVVSAVISDTTDEKNRSKGFGIIGASFGFGFVFGPAIAAFTSKADIRTPFIIAGFTGLIAAALVILFLKETNTKRVAESKGPLIDFSKLVYMLFDEKLGKLLTISFIYNFAWAIFIFTFQPFALKIIKLTPQQIAVIFTTIGIIGLVMQGWLMHKFVKKFGRLTMFRFSFATLVVVFLALFAFENKIVFWGTLAVLSIANSFISPLIQTFLSEKTSPHEQGVVMGLSASYTSLANIAGPLIGGFVATHSIKGTFLVPVGMFLTCLAFVEKFKKQEV